MPIGQGLPFIQAFALCAALLSLGGCASINAQSTEYVGVNHPPPTVPQEVQVLRTEPTRAHVRLGEVVLESSVDPAPPIDQIEQKLREEGAKMGGDAVVVVYDRIQPVAAYVSGPLWDRDIQTISGRKLKGIVIHYTQ